MSNVKWIKINLNMYEDEKIRLIDVMPERDTIHYIWTRLLIQAGKVNDSGHIYLNKDLPFTNKELSIIFNRPLSVIKFALKTLKSYGMIQIDEENYIKITNWEKHQNVEGMEKTREQSRIRMQKLRERKKSIEKKATVESVTQGDVTVTLQKENKNKRIEDLELESENNILTMEEVRDEKKKAEKLEVQAMKVLSFYEKATGKVGLFSPSALILAIDSHGESYVKMAIDKALEVDKPNMNYINGILRNWANSGYPKGGVKYGKCCYSDSGEFEDFKPKKPRELSKEERKEAESMLI